MREVGWWRIKRPNGTPSYGFGTQEEAMALAKFWSEQLGLDVGWFQVDDAPDYVEHERDDGFDIVEELAECEEDHAEKEALRVQAGEIRYRTFLEDQVIRKNLEEA